MSISSPIDFLHALYGNHPKALAILLPHSKAVTNFALSLAKRLPSIDTPLLERAALLHDCGIFLTHAPKIFCTGKAPYLSHGVLGAALLKKGGYDREAAICETHVGVGITKEMIIAQNLPLPHRDFIPQSIEAELVAYADCFFSKREGALTTQKPFEQALAEVSRFGEMPRELFLKWHQKFQ